MSAEDALDRLRSANERDARTFAGLGRAMRVAQGCVAFSFALVALGVGFERASDFDLAAAGSAGVWLGLLGWFVLARERLAVARRNRIELEGFAPSFDPIARMREDRALGTHLAAWGLGALAATAAHAAWRETEATLLVGITAGAVVTVASRVVPIFVAPGVALVDLDAVKRRYQSVPAGLPRSLLVRVRCERRAKRPVGSFVVLGALLAVAHLWAGSAAELVGAMIVAAFLAPVLNALLEARAYARATRTEVRLEESRLVAYDGAERRGEIDLAQPFTYQVLSQSDGEAAYRLDQGKSRIELASTAREAPWIVYDVLKRDWPPRAREARGDA